MSAKNTAATGGVGFFGLLAILFIALKLLGITEVAEWSWVWVVSPLWLPFAVMLGLVLVFFLIIGVCLLFMMLLSMLVS